MCEQLTDDQKTKRPRRNKGVIRAVHRACMQLLEVSRAAGSHLAKLFLASASLWLPKAAGPEILAKRIREDKMDKTDTFTPYRLPTKIISQESTGRLSSQKLNGTTYTYFPC